jgi:hypothetical protein
VPPFLPVFSISRSQSVRLGRGPGNQNVPELDSGDTPFNPQTGALISPFYADFGNSYVRRDYQRHQAIGALIDVGSTSLTQYSDLFTASGLVVSAGTGFTLSLSAGTVQSRYSGWQLSVAAGTNAYTPAPPPAFGNRTDLVVLNSAGIVSIITGAADLAAPTYQVVTLTPSASLSGGSFFLGFSYNGYWFKTATTASSAVASTIATNVLAATGGPNATALSSFAPGAALTGAGGALSAGTAVTLTSSAGLEGNLTNIEVLTSSLTGGTLSAATTTQGVGNYGATPNGNYLVLAQVLVPSTATTSANYTITTGAMQTS